MSARVLGFAVTFVALACSSSEGSGGTPDASAGGSGGLTVTDSSWGGSGAGSGGSPLPCDPGFAFTPDPPITSGVLHVSYTDASPLTYVELQAGSASVSFVGITASNPWTWTWDVTELSPGIRTFTFWAGQPSAQLASCQRNAIDTGTGGSGGAGGGGGTGGHCCKLVGTQLANPSPCGPGESASPWQTLDNAGCNASGCQKIWCPYEKCDSAKYPNGCPQGTEACWIDDSFASYEDACKSCCESYGACWDAALSTCRHPGDCGSPIGKCPWQ